MVSSAKDNFMDEDCKSDLEDFEDDEKGMLGFDGGGLEHPVLGESADEEKLNQHLEYTLKDSEEHENVL